MVFFGDFGLFNKMWMYEESLRLPLLVRCPDKVKSGTVNNEIVSILDFGPTFLDYAQTQIPDELQGRSFRPLLEGNSTTDGRQSHYYHYYGQYDVPGHYGVALKLTSSFITTRQTHGNCSIWKRIQKRCKTYITSRSSHKSLVN